MKILILDDHKMFGNSLKIFLKEQYDIERCDFAWEIDKFFCYLKENRYDIILLDINLKKRITGLDIVEDILKYDENVSIVILTSYDLINYKQRALELGVKDFINKSVEIDELYQRLNNVYEGQIIKNNHIMENSLTDKEIAIIRRLAEGKDRKIVAREFYISERTLQNHIYNIYKKLGVKNIIEAINRCRQIGYIDPFVF